ncbi:hypothetical protein BGZ76_007700 [Entomortierella beljakovae]|nr:hypothetical protein BGZ76_007700 [Entomortierella beljakovae]
MFKHFASRLLPYRGFSTAARTKPFQVAIDGPAASGKSTTAKLVAQRLGFNYIDTGAFYRCVTLAVLSKGIDPSDPANVAKISDIADQAKIKLQTIFAARSTNPSVSHHQTPMPATRVFLDTKDVTLDIRTGQVSKHVSAVAALGDVREAVLQKVRNIGATDDDNHDQRKDIKFSDEGLVMDGRDIGTVVLPHADLKIFLVADSRVRAERRLKELVKNGLDPKLESVESVQKDLDLRDELDRTRKVSPLKKADDAIELDTSHLTMEGQVDAIVDEIERRRKP